MIEMVKQALAHVVQLTKYPKPVVSVINKGPFSTTISKSPKSTIERFCELRGDIELHDHARVGPNSVLHGTITLGRGTNLVQDVRIIGDVQFGNYCAIANDTIFQQINHPVSYPGMQRRLYNRVLNSTLEHDSAGPIIVGSDVWIGVNAIILDDVEIGHGAVVGAGAVVTSDAEPYSIVAGVPAERKGWRFSEPTRSRLLDIKWWEWDESKIRQNEEFFMKKISNADQLPTDSNCQK